MQLPLKRFKSSLAAPGCHRTAELSRLSAREAGNAHGDLHDLLLENGHAQGPFQRLSHLGRGIRDRFQSLAPSQIRVNHIALYRAGSSGGMVRKLKAVPW